MLHQVTIKNFKSLRDVTIDGLKSLNIIIGPNASGKSNLLDALHALQELVRFKGTLKSSSGLYAQDSPTLLVDEILWRKAKLTAEVAWQIGCYLTPASNVEQPQSSPNLQNVDYELALKKPTKSKNLFIDEPPIIEREILSATWPPVTTPQTYLNRLRDQISVQRLNERGLLNPEETDIRLNDLALHYYARSSFPVIQSLNRYIQNWRFYKIIPDHIRSAEYASYIPLGKHKELYRDGYDVANVLHYLREEQPEDFEYIQDELNTILGFSRLNTREEEIDNGGKRNPGPIYLEAEEKRFGRSKPFGPNNLSDGTLGLLALLTILGVSNPAPLICLEEPERSVHPQLLRRLAYYLHEAAQHTQLLITTHNPELLDHFDPYEQPYVQILIAQRDREGATHFIPIHNVQNVKEWLEDYMLGQVWTMGQIEEMLEVE